MKKICLTLVFAFLVCGAFAKDIGLRLDIGAQYANHQLHRYGANVEGFNVHTTHSKHMGGFHIDLNYMLGKNWSVFLNTAFSFNNDFVNDSLLGFGYTFPVAKAFDVFLGAGFGFGGSLFSHKVAATTTSWSAGYVGGGIELKGIVMFSNLIGFYFGVQDNLYAAVGGKVKTVTGSLETKNKRNKNDLPDMVNSILAKVGLRIAF